MMKFNEVVRNDDEFICGNWFFSDGHWVGVSFSTKWDQREGFDKKKISTANAKPIVINFMHFTVFLVLVRAGHLRFAIFRSVAFHK